MFHFEKTCAWRFMRLHIAMADSAEAISKKAA
jgi:hypothetical protein